MLSTHKAGKGPGGCGGWDLGSRNRRGPGCPPPRSQRAWDLTWEPSRLPGLKWAGQSPSTPLLLLLQGPSCLPLLISLASLLCPQGPTQPGGGLEGRGPAWELGRLPMPKWVGLTPSAPLLLLPQGPSHLPLLISPASGALILPGLHLRPTGSLWGSSRLLGGQSPPPAPGRHPSCGEMLTLRLPTLPS